MTTAMFDELTDLYDRYNAVRDRLAPATATWLADRLPGGARAVDLGCGPGRFTPLIADRYDTVLAVDLSEKMIHRARHQRPHPNVTYQQQSLLDITPDQNGTFEAVVTVNTVHHAGALDTVLPHLRRLVTPGGWLLLVDIVNPGRWGDRPWHIEQAFAAARHFYHAGDEDAHAAAEVLRLLAHPRWLDMTVTDIPPARTDYQRHAEQVFPGVTFTDDLHPLRIQTAFTWHAPAA